MWQASYLENILFNDTRKQRLFLHWQDKFSEDLDIIKLLDVESQGSCLFPLAVFQFVIYTVLHKHTQIHAHKHRHIHV